MPNHIKIGSFLMRAAIEDLVGVLTLEHIQLVPSEIKELFNIHDEGYSSSTLSPLPRVYLLGFALIPVGPSS
jgi:hypothetical protein